MFVRVLFLCEVVDGYAGKEKKLPAADAAGNGQSSAAAISSRIVSARKSRISFHTNFSHFS